MTTIITSRVFYPAFIEPTKPLTPSADPRYGCLILAADVPADLLAFIPQGFKPRLTIPQRAEPTT